MQEIASLFQKGGFAMWPITVLSVLALTVIVERVVAISLFLRNGKCAGGNPQEKLNSLQRGFGFVSTVIAAEPMLGILGTVTGIIKTFQALDVETGNPLSATAGIGEALLTTAAVLVAALILLFPYNWLLSLLGKAAVRLESE